jgi:L-ascorbate metabolism protein UlaG (beta-lactamase superfamily)
MAKLWSDCRRVLAELMRLPQSLRGGPGHRGAPSDHFDGRHFFNPGAPTGRSFADFLRWQRTRRASPWPQWRANPPVAAAPGAPAADEMAVTFINHVTFLIQLPGLNILTDPVYCERASPVQWAGPRRVHAPGLAWQQLPALDLVFVSHNHYDHMDLSTLRRLRQAHAPLFLTGLGNASFLRQQGITPVVELDWWEQTSLRGAQLTFTPAQHWSTRGSGTRNHTLWGGLWIATPEHSLYFAADTGYAPWFAQLRQRLGAPEVALLPIGAYEPRWFMRDQHMNPSDAVKALADCGAQQALAHHHGTFQLTDEAIDAPVTALGAALDEAKIPRERFATLKPGQVVEI